MRNNPLKPRNNLKNDTLLAKIIKHVWNFRFFSLALQYSTNLITSMKHSLLIILAVLSSITMPAVERSARPTGKNIRQFNAAGHASTQRRAPTASDAARSSGKCRGSTFHTYFGKGCPEAANYTEINSNGDNRKWIYTTSNGYAALMVPNDPNVDANDDWLITVPSTSSRQLCSLFRGRHYGFGNT